MNVLQVIDFVAKLFMLGAVPWIFLSKENSLYLKVKNIKLAIVFNCFASLMAVSIYLSIYFNKSLVWKDDMTFFYWALPLSALYFIVLLGSHEFVEEEIKKDSYFEVKKLEAIDKKTETQQNFLEKLKDDRATMKILIIIHFILYVSIFTLLAFGLGINSHVNFSS